jgi:hypothetical protein
MLSLQEISDRIEIQQLLYEYAAAIDGKNFDRLDVVFAPDAHVDYRAFGGVAGSYPEAKTWLTKVLPTFPAYQHLMGNAEIRIDGDTATGRVMCFNPMSFPRRQGGIQVAFFGLWYLDTYVRTPAGWRIQSRSEEKSFEHNVPVAP